MRLLCQHTIYYRDELYRLCVYIVYPNVYILCINMTDIRLTSRSTCVEKGSLNVDHAVAMCVSIYDIIS
jgi:hypothetical protein